MLRFRPYWPDHTFRAGPLTPEVVGQLAELVLAPWHFLTTTELRLEAEHVNESRQRWEIYRGRLFDSAHTRQEKNLESWNLFLIEHGTRSTEPLLSIRVDWGERQLHVVRAIHCQVWEGYDSGGGVFLSRETTRWVRELTGTIQLDEMADSTELLDELVSQVFHAVVGASRLPLTSIETPLPDFSLGRLAYCFVGSGLPDQREQVRREDLNRLERVKLLECLLHGTGFEEMPALVECLHSVDVLSLLKTLFNEVSLSPWTDLVDKTLALLNALERQKKITAADAIDFLGSQLIQVGRHLTAYDLVTFHHRGANYPDALLLDSFLKDCLRRIEQEPELFLGPGQGERWRRRALRQGWLLRCAHEGLPVPDAPTSPGENMRVLPSPHVRVPEEQILHPVKRRRLLHAGDPLSLGPRAEQVLRQSVGDLEQGSELREMGLALFLDRPLGTGKAPGEPDQTVLLSHRAYSRSIAQRRLRFLAEKLHLEGALSGWETALAALSVPGVALEDIGGEPRPGAVSAADARQVAGDFVFLQTVSATVEELFRQYDFSQLWERLFLHELKTGRGLLMVPRTNGRLTIHDSGMRPRVELSPDLSQGYVRRAGREMVRGGLLVKIPCGQETIRLPAQY
jgi:hypothetical protein